MGGRVFAIEDDAYERLNGYLAEIRDVFAHYPDATEIVADMEDRMADQFEGQGTSSAKYITLLNIENLIATMGSAEDLRKTVSAEEHQNQPVMNTDNVPRKLFRNPDDKILLGVCSGLAAYFGIDPVFIRLAFVIGTFLGGSGILLYIVLYLIMPEAKTTTEKMAMRGEPITLAGVVEQVKTEFSEEKNEARLAAVKKNFHETSQKIFTNNPSSLLGKVGRALKRIMYFLVEIVRRFLERVLPICIRIIGIFVLLAGLGLLFAPITFGTFLLTNSVAALGPWASIVTGTLLVLLTVLAVVAGSIPATLIVVLGVSMLRYKNTFPKRLSIALIVVWICILGTLGVAVVSHLPRWNDTYERQNISTTRTIPLTGSFNKISVDDNYYHLRIVSGPTTSLRLSGTADELQKVVTEVRNNELHIATRQKNRWQLVTNSFLPEVIITVPNFEQITINGHSTAEISGLQQPSISIIANSGSVTATNNHIDHYELSLGEISAVDIEGSTSTITAELRGPYAKLYTLDSTITDANLKLSRGASAHLGIVTGSLTVVGSERNSVYYLGTPHVITHISADSIVAPYPSSLWDNEERANYSSEQPLEE